MKKTRSKKSRDTVPLSITNNEILQNSKSKPRKFLILVYLHVLNPYNTGLVVRYFLHAYQRYCIIYRAPGFLAVV
jgi:hypothetical protein